jgi:FkbM family methyltransferase
MIKVKSLLTYPFLVPNVSFLKKLIKNNIEPSEIAYNWFKKELLIKKLNIKISSSQNLFLLNRLDLAFNLYNSLNANFWTDENEKINVQILDLSFYINSWEELFILNEIFLNGVYNLEVSYDFIFLDIGMNVAFTSLFIANKPNNLCTFSYEPFNGTYRSAIQNIQRNDKIAKKINVFNFGISNKNEEVQVSYLKEMKGSVGLGGIPERVLNKELRKQIILEKIFVKSIDEIISEIRKSYPNQKIIAKIDCEGSEYEIFECLNRSNSMKELSIIMLEWHSKGPGELTDSLMKNGFSCFSFGTFNKDVGMIYAQKNDFK